jgi:hypothetical protein
MDLTAFYVLVSRVTEMKGLRVLYRDELALNGLQGLEQDEYLLAWDGGYEQPEGEWKQELALYVRDDVRAKRLARADGAKANLLAARKSAFLKQKASRAEQKVKKLEEMLEREWAKQETAKTGQRAAAKRKARTSGGPTPSVKRQAPAPPPSPQSLHPDGGLGHADGGPAAHLLVTLAQESGVGHFPS